MGVCRSHVCAAVYALPFRMRLCAAVARLVKDVFESAAGIDAVGAVSDYLRSQRVTSLPDLQVYPTQAKPDGTVVLLLVLSVPLVAVQHGHKPFQPFSPFGCYSPWASVTQALPTCRWWLLHSIAICQAKPCQPVGSGCCSALASANSS